MSIGIRLRQYRTARGYTLDELVERMNGLVSKQALSKYEHDRADPRPKVLLALASALDIKASRLLAEPEYRFEPIAYRAFASMPKSERESIESAITLDLENRLSLRDALGMPIEYPFADDRYRVIHVSDAEYAAERLRQAWNLGGEPIANLAEMMESKGVYLIEVEASRQFDGLAMLTTDEHGVPVSCGVALRREVTRSRQRMNLAHEIGHLVMDTSEGVDTEAAARRFAGAFLYPQQAACTEFGSRRSRVTMDELLAAKQRWGISIQGVLYRLRDLGIIDGASYTWWCKYINRAGWRAEEPGEEPRERSNWNFAHAHRAAAEGLISRETLAEYVPGLSSRTVPEDIDRRELRKLPLAERHAQMKAHAEACAAEYGSLIDEEWCGADLDSWGEEDD
ncbi:MAG: helix-turn-helix domain-containing protein [Coriobacteriia bacterium]